MKKIFFLILIIDAFTSNLYAQYKVTNTDENMYYNQIPTNGKIKGIQIERLSKSYNASGLATYKIDTKTIYRFSEKGNEVDQVLYGGQEDTIQRTTFNYPNDTVVITNLFGRKNHLQRTTTYKYNNYGQEREAYPVENYPKNLYKKITYKYNKNNCLIEKITYAENGNVFKDTISYNNKNQKIKSDTWGPKTHINILYEYDNSGILQKTTLSINNSVGVNTHYLFADFDKYGNWQTLTEEDSFFLPQIVKRHITYYE